MKLGTILNQVCSLTVAMNDNDLYVEIIPLVVHLMTHSPNSALDSCVNRVLVTKIKN